MFYVHLHRIYSKLGNSHEWKAGFMICDIWRRICVVSSVTLSGSDKNQDSAGTKLYYFNLIL